jgi:hypothetical protein
MARLTGEKAARLEQELISMFQDDPSTSYRDALETITNRHPDLAEELEINDINYRVAKLRRTGAIPAGQRGGRRTRSAAGGGMHPVAKAYQELDAARGGLDQAQARYDAAQRNLRRVLKENLSDELLQSLTNED